LFVFISSSSFYINCDRGFGLGLGTRGLGLGWYVLDNISDLYTAPESQNATAASNDVCQKRYVFDFRLIGLNTFTDMHSGWQTAPHGGPIKVKLHCEFDVCTIEH